jgi:hypothetical protein
MIKNTEELTEEHAPRSAQNGEPMDAGMENIPQVETEEDMLITTLYTDPRV